MKQGKYKKGDNYLLDFTVLVARGTIVYANDVYAVARLEGGDAELYEFLMEGRKFCSCEEIKMFIEDFKEERPLRPHEEYLVIDNQIDSYIDYRSLLRKHTNIFAVGKEYDFPDGRFWFDLKGVFVYQTDLIAFVKVYDGYHYEGFSEIGYTADEIKKMYPDFKDEISINCSQFFYLLIRKSDEEYLDLEGNVVD